MKLPGFPVAQHGAGETLASVIARYLERSAAPRTLLLNLLGLYVASPISVIPTNLRQFASIMPPGHPWKNAPEVIAKGHTLAPLFLHFAHPERAASTLNAVITGNSKNPTTSLGISATMSRNIKRAGKFCPDCLANDLNTLGYSAFYRQHQPPFVKMCAVHARPLHSNCLCCQNSRKAIGRWQMAGRCGCSASHKPPILETNLDAKAEEAWLWLSRQVATILADPDFIPRVHVAANLLTALRCGGFASEMRSGLDPETMTEALRDRFSESFLRQLGIARWCEPPKLSPANMLVRSVIDGRRIPSVLRMLLLARLVTDDIASLWNPVAPELTPYEVPLPLGYGRSANNDRMRVDKEAIALALDDANGKITVAAKRLGVHAGLLAADLRHHGIRLPLPVATSKRLGAERIAVVREALAQGIPKNDIVQQYDVSKWSILLIELDRPELSNAHREATADLQRKKHRNALLLFMRDTPSESRRTFAKRYAGSYGWLQKYDRAWLNTHLPKSRRGRGKGKRKALKDWHQLDQAAAMAVRHSAREELAKHDRPKPLTRSRLLSAAGASVALRQKGRNRYPTAVAEAECLSETKEQFLRRTIRWALQKYAGQQIAISINRLYQVSRLSPDHLKEHRHYIIEVAAELELTFDARSGLAHDASNSPALASRKS